MNTFLKGYYGFAFFIFQIYKEAMQSGRRVNHENIHFIQQAELLFVFSMDHIWSSLCLAQNCQTIES